jgi:hypothetical protein
MRTHINRNSVEDLRAEAERLDAWRDEPLKKEAKRLFAVASLLEVHDATGINLIHFGGVLEFVNDVLTEYRLPLVVDNGA